MRTLLILALLAATAAVHPGTVGGAAGLLVERHGFSEEHVTLPSGGAARLGSYGVVLFNASRLDAREVAVTVSGFMAGGRKIVDDRQTLLVVPPRTRYYLGGGWAVRNASVARLRVRTSVGSWIRLGWRLPAVSGVRATWPRGGDATVTGVVRNVHDEFRLSRETLVSVVLFDRDGEIVGGAGSSLGASPAPGASVRFRLEAFGGRRTAALTARVSIEPRLTPYR